MVKTIIHFRSIRIIYLYWMIENSQFYEIQFLCSLTIRRNTLLLIFIRLIIM